MKMLLLLLLLPVFAFAQTVHIKDEKIVYEGKEKINSASASQVFERMQKVLPDIINNYKSEEQSAHSIKARGEMKLRTPYNVVRTVSYSIKVNALQDGYEYIIDSVAFTERERGGKISTKQSSEVLENMGETGKIVGDTEKLLNETDMRFQKLLALLKLKTAGY